MAGAVSDLEKELSARAASPGLAKPVIAAHAATLVAAFATWAYLDRNLWFFGDEWDFLTRRGLHGAYFSIWTAHNEHWSVLPILLWRAIYSFAHVSSYWPYLVPLLIVHVSVVHLVWRRCLICGADPWMATAAAGVLGLLGSGAEDLTWAFQVGFLGSLVFGLLAIEVVEGPRALVGRVEKPMATMSRFPGSLLRSALTSALALAALMCSTVGVATAVALAIVVLAWYGWRRTLAVLAAPVFAFGVWFALSGHSGLGETGDYFSRPVFAGVPRFVLSNATRDLGDVAGSTSVGPPVAAAVLAWLAWSCWRRSLAVRRPAVLGGAVGAVVFYALAALGRDRISPTMSPSRYVYIGAVLLLPSLALLLSAVWKGLGGSWSGGWLGASWSGRWLGNAAWLLRPVVIVLVVLATWSNVAAGVAFARNRTVYVHGLENQIVTTATLLQQPGELALAINGYPIWASGFASGYLTPRVLAQLERQRVLPRARTSLMASSELLSDETWLDVARGNRPLFAGQFVFESATGVGWRLSRPVTAMSAS
ncbi:MAG TPA: hypothetical protein VED59_03615, partial [Acidimicrobiales bacterium]|nr:hypothetical protein [Acidimicrobiales bacterium]